MKVCCLYGSQEKLADFTSCTLQQISPTPCTRQYRRPFARHLISLLGLNLKEANFRKNLQRPLENFHKRSLVYFTWKFAWIRENYQ